jgi:hypothetical protein
MLCALRTSGHLISLSILLYVYPAVKSSDHCSHMVSYRHSAKILWAVSNIIFSITYALG